MTPSTHDKKKIIGTYWDHHIKPLPMNHGMSEQSLELSRKSYIRGVLKNESMLQQILEWWQTTQTCKDCRSNTDWQSHCVCPPQDGKC